jgi:hypothetical protein
LLFHCDFPDGMIVSSYSPSKPPVQSVPVFGEHNTPIQYKIQAGLNRDRPDL